MFICNKMRWIQYFVCASNKLVQVINETLKHCKYVAQTSDFMKSEVSSVWVSTASETRSFPYINTTLHKLIPLFFGKYHLITWIEYLAWLWWTVCGSCLKMNIVTWQRQNHYIKKKKKQTLWWTPTEKHLSDSAICPRARTLVMHRMTEEVTER